MRSLPLTSLTGPSSSFKLIFNAVYRSKIADVCGSSDLSDQHYSKFFFVTQHVTLHFLRFSPISDLHITCTGNKSLQSILADKSIPLLGAEFLSLWSEMQYRSLLDKTISLRAQSTTLFLLFLRTSPIPVFAHFFKNTARLLLNVVFPSQFSIWLLTPQSTQNVSFTKPKACYYA